MSLHKVIWQKNPQADSASPEKRQDRVADFQNGPGQITGRARGKTQSEAIRNALAGDRRPEIVQSPRDEIPWRNLLIEIDIYRRRHLGLVVAEVGLPDRVTCRKFRPPSWFGREVTGEKRYSNVRLANE